KRLGPRGAGDRRAVAAHRDQGDALPGAGRFPPVRAGRAGTGGALDRRARGKLSVWTAEQRHAKSSLALRRNIWFSRRMTTTAPLFPNATAPAARGFVAAVNNNRANNNANRWRARA